MSSIYDNIEQPILPELQHYLKQAYRADFCVGYCDILPTLTLAGRARASLPCGWGFLLQRGTHATFLHRQYHRLSNGYKTSLLYHLGGGYISVCCISTFAAIQIKRYLSESANNLYAFCMERATKLLNQPAWFGMIVPTSVVGLDDTASLRSVLLETFSVSICSTYSIRPSQLFEGVDQRLCIYVGKSDKAKSNKILSSKYCHWSSDERDILFSNLEYSNSFVYETLNRIAQTGYTYSTSILEKLRLKNSKPTSRYYCQNNSGYIINYHRSPRYWIRAINFEPYFKSSSRSRSIHHVRDLSLCNEEQGKFVGSLLNSSLFFFWFISLGNGRNITSSDVHNMPVGEIDCNLLKEISVLFDKLMEDYQKNSFIRTRQDCEFQEFRQNLSKLIIDEIDRVLAQHYGFTDEELDFIINYDIKHRMGRDAGGDDA